MTRDIDMLEACALGTEAIRIAQKANALPVADIRRWQYWQRMLTINHRLNELAQEVRHRENRTV